MLGVEELRSQIDKARIFSGVVDEDSKRHARCSDGCTLSAWLREILQLAGAAAIAVVMTACSAPATEARARNQSSFSATPAPEATEPAASGERKPRGVETPKEPLSSDAHSRCPKSMVPIEGLFCIDRYEATLVDVLANGEERAHSPFTPVEHEQPVRAVTSPNVFPQGYISAVEAQSACIASGKRLCRVAEWGRACRGPEAHSFGYADRREPGRCNDHGRNPVVSLFGRGHWTWQTMNLPQLNQLDGTLAKTGEHGGCTNGYGVYDMVGNLHEWVADPSGTFYGGYYQDVASVGHGAGCAYQTTAHEARYHDYSTGFRCCADVAGAQPGAAKTPAKGARKH